MTKKTKTRILHELDRKQELPTASITYITLHGEDAFHFLYDAVKGGTLKPRQVVLGFVVMWRFGMFSLTLRSKLLELLLDETRSENELQRSRATMMTALMYTNARTLSGIPSRIDTSKIVDTVRAAHARGIDRMTGEYVQQFLDDVDAGRL